MFLCRPIFADEDTSRLAIWLSGIESFEAEFVQLTRTQEGEEISRFEGIVRLSKPDQFWWEITDPYSLYYVLDGEQVIEYDPDLEQVTYRPTAQLGDVPLVSLLMQNDGSLIDRFTVEGQVNHFLLTPKLETELFRSISIFFDKDLLDAIDVIDHNQDTIEFSFKNMNPAPEFRKSSFELDVPDHVDVIGIPIDKETSQSP